ncbi:MAG: energy transducer TonB [Bacteroidales bacterium]|jgi:protein TonB|nr:energy transducer TonB [Bacteroidales bacterium]
MKKLILLAAVALFCGTSAMAQTDEVDDAVFVVVEKSPEFPGGDDSLYAFIGRNIKYPEAAKKNKIEGRVFVTFVIEKDGQVSSAKILRDIGGGCGEEALRVVNSMPKWKPGTQRGNPVRVQFNLPIMFQLQKQTSDSK